MSDLVSEKVSQPTPHRQTATVRGVNLAVEKPSNQREQRILRDQGRDHAVSTAKAAVDDLYRDLVVPVLDGHFVGRHPGPDRVRSDRIAVEEDLVAVDGGYVEERLSGLCRIVGGAVVDRVAPGALPQTDSGLHWPRCTLAPPGNARRGITSRSPFVRESELAASGSTRGTLPCPREGRWDKNGRRSLTQSSRLPY